MVIIAKPPDREYGGNMPTAYEKDIIQWSEEQAHFLLSRQFDKLDLENLADEVLDVGKSELRELKSRMAVLLAHLIKWAWQPTHRSRSWENTIRLQRMQLMDLLKETPSLKSKMADEEISFWPRVWRDAILLAGKETGISTDLFPETMPWPEDNIMQEGWYPDSML